MLNLFGFDVLSTFQTRKWLNEKILEDLKARVSSERNTDFQLMANLVLEVLKNDEKVPISQILDKILPFLREDDFILKK